MSLRSTLRRRVSAWLVLALLVMQFATAAHACPMGMAMAEDMGTAGLPTSALCMHHCQGDTASVAAAHALSVPPPALLPTLTPWLPDAAVTALAEWAAQARVRDRPPPLAHSVLHCCYRI